MKGKKIEKAYKLRPRPLDDLWIVQRLGFEPRFQAPKAKKSFSHYPNINVKK
jgi:hypothetical protein